MKFINLEKLIKFSDKFSINIFELFIGNYGLEYHVGNIVVQKEEEIKYLDEMENFKGNKNWKFCLYYIISSKNNNTPLYSAGCDVPITYIYNPPTYTYKYYLFNKSFPLLEKFVKLQIFS